MMWRASHKALNTALAFIALVLITWNLIDRQHQIREADNSAALSLPQHTLEVISKKHLVCTDLLYCASSGRAIPLSGNGFHQLDVFGEEWSQRQFVRHQVPLNRRLLDMTRLDLCAATTSPQGEYRVITTIPSNSLAFSLQLVSTQDGCSGVLCLKRLTPGPSQALAKKLQQPSEESLAFLTNGLKFGPDDFRLRLVGGDVVSHLVYHLASSDSYAFPFDIVHPGPFHVELEHMYENFLALDETFDGTIPMVRSHVLATVEQKGPYGEIEGAQHHFPKFNLYHMQATDNPTSKILRKSKFRASKLFTWDQFTFRSNHGGYCKNASMLSGSSVDAQLQMTGVGDCFSLAHQINLRLGSPKLIRRAQGQWTFSRHNSTFPKDFGLHEMRKSPEHHTHFERTDPQAIFEYRLFRDVCPIPLIGFTLNEFAQRVTSRIGNKSFRIALFGDSHLRVTYTHLRNFLVSNTTCPLEDHMVKSMSSRMCTYTPTPRAQPIVLSMEHDVLLENFIAQTSQLDHSIDVAVLGFGSWALGGKGSDPSALAKAPADFGRWSLFKYKSTVEAICRVIVRFLHRSPTKRVVWASIPAYPPNTRRFAKLKGEHRTNPRIYAFNEAAFAVFAAGVPQELRAQFRIVDTFDVTYPMMHLSLDHNHHTSYAQDAILQILLNSLV